jgi:hypothetical protein
VGDTTVTTTFSTLTNTGSSTNSNQQRQVVE